MLKKTFGIYNDQLKALVENNQHFTKREMVEMLNVSQKIVMNNLRRLGYVCRCTFGYHMKKYIRFISIYDSLLKRNSDDSILMQMIMDDKKWIINDNVVRKRCYRKSYQKKMFRKLYIAYDGILKTSFIMNFFGKGK